MRVFLGAFVLSILIHFISFYEIKLEHLPKPQLTDKKTHPKGQQVKFIKLQPKMQKEQKKQTSKPPKEYKKVDPKNIKPQSKKVNKVKQPVKPRPIAKTGVTPNYTPPPPDKPTKEPFNLNDFLNAKEDPNDTKDDVDEITKSYIQLYGEEFNSFSDDTKQYLKNSLKDIAMITQRYLEYPYLAAYAKQSGKNIIEFYLYPDGTISDAKIISSSGYNILDWNTLDTIEKAYRDYPRPKEKTKIIIYVHYKLY